MSNSDPKVGNSLSQFEVKPGDKLTAARHNAMLRELARNHIDMTPGRRTGAGDSGLSPILVTVAKDGGVVGPPSTWTYTCTSVSDATATWAAVANRVLRSTTLKYDFAPNGTYAILFVIGGTPYLFLPELPQEYTCA